MLIKIDMGPLLVDPSQYPGCLAIKAPFSILDDRDKILESGVFSGSSYDFDDSEKKKLQPFLVIEPPPIEEYKFEPDPEFEEFLEEEDSNDSEENFDDRFKDKVFFIDPSIPLVKDIGLYTYEYKIQWEDSVGQIDFPRSMLIKLQKHTNENDEYWECSLSEHLRIMFCLVLPDFISGASKKYLEKKYED